MIDTDNIVYQFQTLAEYTVRREGRHIVVPVVMMVDGVHAGSEGPILHQQQYFGQNPTIWDQVPLTAGHPVDGEGQVVSVNAVDANLWVVGYVRNTRMDNGKLKAEAWIDQQRAVAINPEILNYINEGRRLEVSTGAFTNDVQTMGQWNDEEYKSVTVAYQPDHLALLPGLQGACNWNDGCGIRTNEQIEKEELNEMSELTFQQLKQAVSKVGLVQNRLQANEAGFMEISQALSTKLDRMDSEARMYFLSEVYDAHFVYHVRDRDQGSDRYYTQSYAIQENKEVQFSGDPQEVRKNVEFVVIQQNQGAEEEDCGCGGGNGLRRTKFNINKQKEDDTMSEANNNKPSGEVMDKVVSLIANERTKFTKADRDWLLTLNESQLDKMEPGEAPKAEVTREEALQVLSEDLADTSKLVEVLPSGVRSQVEAGIKAYNDHRASLVKTIQDNAPEGVWQKEQLNTMETSVLEGIAKSVRKPDYSGNGPIINNQAGENEEHLLPAGVKLK